LHRLRREALVLAVVGGFGIAILPALVYLVGQQLLGEYRPDAGMGAFYADLYGELGRLNPWVWLLLMGPYLSVQLLRLLWLPLRRRDAAPPPPTPPGDSNSSKRVEPTI
jgi:hypothetical protein